MYLKIFCQPWNEGKKASLNFYLEAANYFKVTLDYLFADNLNEKKNILIDSVVLKIRAFIPLLILILMLSIQFILPSTNLYANWEYRFNQNKRERIVRMFNSEEQMELTQINVQTYMLPLSLRTVSHNAKVIAEKDETSLKLLFYSHRGLIHNSAIVYTSDIKGVKNGDFGIGYDKIKALNAHWFRVTHH